MQRIQKFLAQYGIASRRTIEDWIKLQRIKIDGKIAKLGDQINGSEEIRLDNKILEHKNFTNTDNTIKIILYHKPVGKICTRSDPKNRPTVFADLPELTIGRWVAVGRLDLNTSGILLFTNNGDVANKLILTEGKNREIKRLFASQGLIVNRLIRIRFGDIVLPKTLQTGEYIPIKVDPQSL